MNDVDYSVKNYIWLKPTYRRIIFWMYKKTITRYLLDFYKCGVIGFYSTTGVTKLRRSLDLDS